MPAFDAVQRRAALGAFRQRHADQIKSIAQWEKRAGLGEGTLRKFLKGSTASLEDKTYGQLADAASVLIGRPVATSELQGLQPSDATTMTGMTTALSAVQNERDQPVTTLIIWKLVHGESDQQGAFVLTSQRVGEMPRPEPVAQAKKAFSCKLLDNANAPGYRAGHVVVVDPDVGAQVGDLCIFTDETKVPTGSPSVAAIFVRRTASHWIVTQNSVPGVEQQLPRAEYPQAWPVVVHYPHGP